MKLEINLAANGDIGEVARIHSEEIRTGFLSSLGEKFLFNLYESLSNSKNAFLFVAKFNGKVVGFVSATNDINNFYKDFYKAYFFKTLRLALPHIWNPKFLRNIIEIMQRPMKHEKLVAAEFLAMGVLPGFRGEGVATKLFQNLLAEMKKRGVRKFKAIISEELKPSMRFNEKMGLKFHSFTNVHKGIRSRIYVYSIK